MKETCTTKIEIPVRTLTLHQLAGLWSTAMSVLLEATHSSGALKRRGAQTESSFYFQDPDELARSALDTRSGDLRLDYIRVSNVDAAVYIGERRRSISEIRLRADAWRLLLTSPNVLELRIHGSDERQVMEIRDALEQWAKQHLKTSSQQIRLKVASSPPASS